MTSPCHSITSRPVSVTSPMTSAATSHFAQMARNASRLSGRDDRGHALLRLAHEDLLGSQRRVAQRHGIEPHVHAALAVARELARGARDARGAEVLDALDEPGVQHLERALDEQLLHERVADLHGGTLGGAAVVEGLRREDRGPADAVAAGLGAVEHDEVADAARAREVDVLVAHRADAERVHERVALVARVEHDLAADVGQAQAVSVAADAGDDARQHAVGVGVVGRTEAQRIHHRDRDARPSR